MPEIALETGKVRTLVSAEPERELGRLLVFVDDRMLADGRAEIVLKSFVDYDRAKWVATRPGDTTAFSQ